MMQNREIYEEFQGYKSCLGKMHPDCKSVKTPEEIMKAATGIKSVPVLQAYGMQVNCWNKNHAAQQEEAKFLWIISKEGHKNAKVLLDYSEKPFAAREPR